MNSTTTLGFCPIHCVVCPVHPKWYYQSNESCKYCNEAMEREVVAARKERERRAKAAEKDKRDAFFNEKGKDRKPKKERPA